MVFTLEEIAKLTQCELKGNPKHVIRAVASIEHAQSFEAAFLVNSRYLKRLEKTQAGVIFVHKDQDFPNHNLLRSDHPSRAFQTLAEAFFNEDTPSFPHKSIHPTAIIHPSAKLGKGVSIAPYSVIEKNVVIGDFSKIASHVYVGAGACLGKNCQVFSNVVIREGVLVGDEVIFQPGAVVGSCGYGYTFTSEGQHEKIRQIGHVIIENNVEIGANTTIDRARIGATKVSKGTKIDNQVQIAHGAQIGECNLLVAQCGVAGSSKLGKYVTLAGQSGVAGHLNICDKVTLAAKGGITKNIDQPGQYGGFPAIPIAHFRRKQVLLSQIEAHTKKIKDLEKSLRKLETIITNQD